MNFTSIQKQEIINILHTKGEEAAGMQLINHYNLTKDQAVALINALKNEYNQEPPKSPPKKLPIVVAIVIAIIVMLIGAMTFFTA